MTTFGVARGYRAVEVLGPPGAGKSALAAALADHSEVRIVKRYRGARYLPCALRSWAAVAPTVLRDPMRRSLSRRQLTWIARLEASAGMLELHGSPGAVIVFDQGPIYTLARLPDIGAVADGMLADGPLARWRQAKIGQWARLLDLIVVLDAPEAVLLHRIDSRSKSHALKGLSDGAALARDRAAYAGLLEELTEEGLRALRLDSGTSSVPEMANAVFAALAEDTFPARRDVPRAGGVVELCGLPGAGKTTLARALVRTLTDNGHTVRTGPVATGPDVPAPRRLAVKAALALRETLAHPACTVASVAAISRSAQEKPADLPARALQWTLAQRSLRAAPRRPSLHVLDEGAVQALWSLGLRGDVGPMLRAWEHTPGWVGPDLVVVVEAPLDVIHDRLAARPSRHSRTQTLDPMRQLLELERGERLLDRLVSWWSGIHGPDSIARIRDHEDVARLVRRVDELPLTRMPSTKKD